MRHALGDHAWFTISTHPTHDGPVTYQRCPCGRWRTLCADEVLTDPTGRCERLRPLPPPLTPARR